MSQAPTPAREGLSKGRSLTAGRARAWGWVLLAGPLLMGACSSESSADAAGGGGYRNKSTSGGSSPSNLGGYSSGDGSSSSSGMAGGAASSENAGAGGASSRGGTSSSSWGSSFGGAGPGGGASGYGGKGGTSGAAGAGGSPLSSRASGSGSSSPVPSGGSIAAGGATGTKASTGAVGGATGMGGRTGAGGGTGTAGGGSTLPPSRDAGAMDGGVYSPDARGGDCSFSGGSVTGTVYPGGLTLRKACSPYFVNAITVNDDGVLTVEPGVTVKFSNGGALLVGMQGSGRLVASGNSSELITFTSQEVQPSPGFWRGLVFGGGTTSSKLAYAQVSAAGQSRDGAIVGMAELPANVLSIDHVTIDKVGDGASGIMALGEKSSIAITNSAFVDVPADRYPISVYAASFSSIGAGNTYPSGSAIEVMGGTIDTGVSWTNPGLPVAITGDLSIQGTSSPVLSVGSGMNLKFASNVAVQVGRSAPGKVTIAGTSQARVTLTSLASSPASGSWAGLQIWDSGKATISYTDVRYGGTNNGDSRGNVSVESGAATVQLAVDHSSFSDSLGWGIYVPCVASSQNAAIITVDTNTTYVNNLLGTKGPGLTCAN